MDAAALEQTLRDHPDDAASWLVYGDWLLEHDDVRGALIAWRPSARHKAVRFVDAERIDAAVRGLFARPSEAAPHLAAVFVDPRELSFRTFENIVALDRLFEGSPLELALDGVDPDELYDAIAEREPDDDDDDD